MFAPHQESPNIVINGTIRDLVRGAGLLYFAITQNNNMLAQPQGLINVVRDEHDRLMQALLQG
jgi:hypothetical protein